MTGPSWQRGEAADDRTIEVNWLFELRRERWISRNSNRSHDFFVLHLADAVQVIALTPDRNVILVRQFRAGSGRDSLEPPGGLVNPGEDLLVAGARELLEETGYAGDSPCLLGKSYSNPSLMTSRISTILVTNARPTAAPHPDPGEEVAVEFIPADAIATLIRDGRIDHALAVGGLLMWLLTEFR